MLLALVQGLVNALPQLIHHGLPQPTDTTVPVPV
jgi:hypothetical protein